MCTDRMRLIAVVLLAALLGSCGGEAPDEGGPATPAAKTAATPTATPEGTIKGMLALAEAGKWKEYVLTYYGERHKMDKPETQVAELAAAMETVGEQLLETLRACAKEAPTLSDDGTRATFSNGFKLHKRDGKWGFHL